MERLNGPDGATLLNIYGKVSLIKQCDERLIRLIRSGRLAAPYYSPRGQEVIPAAISVLLNDDDYVVTIYRGLHDHLAKGVPLKGLLAEYFGRAAGHCKGKGGPMHITHPASGVVMTTGIVGSGIPIANGLGWASQLRGDGRIAVTNFGDGASNIGAFHEGLNLAAVWKLPVIFVCQNNQWAEHTSLAGGTSVTDIANRGAAYDMPSILVDGNDARAMWGAAREAVERARNGGGPTLIEAKTFRFNGHNLGDPAHYIPEEELAAWQLRDPHPALRALLIAEGHATEAEIAAIEESIAAEIEDAVAYAMEQPYPDESEGRLDIYDEEIAI
ncbi:pyruvate dehydrogenase E1 component subunit alpha [Novosphingobium endophyticum]|uniref:Pyruvate dehydrogenase E1 component subunit alpha n=1 Tax=Novosphingobium endophyticum TaxID=1955250 RepID=A0A916TSX3_9SPHN|nr:pyruvate dehydrogenase E1 component subunit alpha [Novosphingobium endophyticum]